MTAVRVLALLVGVLLLAAVAHATVMYTGGYGTAQSWLTLAVAAGAGVGGVCTGVAWTARRRALAACFAFAIVAGEAFGFIQTAERLVTAREVLQAPLRAIEEAHGKATKRVAEAAAAVAAAPTSSRRLQDALAAKAAADAAVVAKSAEKGCAANCRALLQAQVDAAGLEVEAARAQLAKHRSEAEVELTAAHNILAGIKAPQSPTPLADRLGLSAWAIDLVTAALGSIAANGLAICLLVFGAHHHSPPRQSARQELEPTGKAELAPTTTAIRRMSPQEHVAAFLRAALKPDPAGETSLRQLHAAYGAWACDRQLEPLSAVDLGMQFRALVDAIGLQCEPTDNDVVIRGAIVAPACGNVLALPPRRGSRIGPRARHFVHGTI
jgi:hypothetical protein